MDVKPYKPASNPPLCPSCLGHGVMPWKGEGVVCPHCGGTGRPA